MCRRRDDLADRPAQRGQVDDRERLRAARCAPAVCASRCSTATPCARTWPRRAATPARTARSTSGGSAGSPSCWRATACSCWSRPSPRSATCATRCGPRTPATAPPTWRCTSHARRGGGGARRQGPLRPPAGGEISGLTGVDDPYEEPLAPGPHHRRPRTARRGVGRHLLDFLTAQGVAGVTPTPRERRRVTCPVPAPLLPVPRWTDAAVAVAPPGDGPGNWAGAPSAVLVDGVVLPGLPGARPRRRGPRAGQRRRPLRRRRRGSRPSPR